MSAFFCTFALKIYSVQEMIVYNTTYTMPINDARDFVIWVSQSMLPRIANDGRLLSPRILRILSHHNQETECMSLQFNVESTAVLHRWYTDFGYNLINEMNKMFNKRIIGFSTIMEEIEV